jgi:hypothetical protein
MRITKRQIVILLTCSALAGAVTGRLTRFAEERRTRPKAKAPPPAAVVPSSRAVKPFEAAERIYDGKLGAGWQDWGWGRHDLSLVGPARVVFGGYAGIVFHRAELSSDFGALAFRFKAPAAWPPFFTVWLKHAQRDDTNFPRIDVKAEDIADLGNGWKEAWIAWSRLNPKNQPIDRVAITASKQVPSDWVELDKVVLTARDGPAGPAPERDAELAVHCDQPGIAINPMIYGITMDAWGTGSTGLRIGGNPSSRLNWDLGAVWNAGSDWFFENTSGTGSVWEWVEAAVARRARVAVTVPMLGWVAKDSTSFGFPVSKFGKQREHDPHRPEAGSGFLPNGTKIRPGPPTQTSVAATPEVIARWIAALRAKDSADGARGVHHYILDNEPSLWSDTHRDVHPDPLGQDELLQRTVAYASAIRGADPETPIAGPAEWGWTGYLYSGIDRATGIGLRPDRRAHGDIPLIAWYLQKLAEHEKTKGVRLLDVLDLHFYPQAERIYGANARVDAEGAALRLRSTRALWDPTYTDESWIREPIRLIPRMREWVAANYPGLKLSLGEWSFGAEEHMSGALATAEALGRFGQQGLDSAFYWDGPRETTRTFWAFRAYRNFDGAGGRFLDWTVPTRETEQLSFFVSRNEAGTQLALVIINRDPKFAYRARVNTGSCRPITRRRAFTYAGDPRGIVAEPAGLVGPALVELVPPYSIRIVDLELARTP